MNNRCRCDGFQMRGSDHCVECGCEEFEERCDWDEGREWSDRSDGSKFSQAMRRGRDRVER